MKPLNVLFVGSCWRGSCARSVREALERRSDLRVVSLEEEVFFPRRRDLLGRGLNRIRRPLDRWRFSRAILKAARRLRPDWLVVYKGNEVARPVERVKRLGISTANVYPDCSPHAFGRTHRHAVGHYDIVISSKPFHPELWASTYGYANKCVFVPQGYDPTLHLRDAPPGQAEYDVALVATYRPEYGRLMREFARAMGDYPTLRVVIGGDRWQSVRGELPQHWCIVRGVQGMEYVSLLRSARIVVAPVTRDVVVNGQRQPGDVDTTRTYELAAAHCFFVHKRTHYVEQLFAGTGLPLFDDGVELASHVRHFLAHAGEREKIAAAAHRRAVPAFSLDNRAADIATILYSTRPRS